MKALKYLLVKEYKQLWRNRILPIVFILLPFGMMNVVPRIATQEVKNLKIAVIDSDRSTLSSRLVQKLSASDYFRLAAICPNYTSAHELIKSGDADFVLTIEPDFERNLYRSGGAEVMTTVNAVNGMKGGLGNSYLSQIVMQYVAELNRETGLATPHPVSIEPRFLFNQKLEYKPYMIPALMVMTLILLVGFLPALNIVGEKERGTIEQINVTPIGKLEFILSKMIPYWSGGLFIVLFSILLAWRFQGVLPAGSIPLILLFCMVYTLAISSIGLIISNYSDNMRQAAIVMFFFVVIFILTSGLISPISSMPDWAKEATRLNPLRYIITAMREIYLKGSSLHQLLPQFLPLCLFAALTSLWAILSYRKNA